MLEVLIIEEVVFNVVFVNKWQCVNDIRKYNRPNAWLLPDHILLYGYSRRFAKIYPDIFIHIPTPTSSGETT